MRSIYLNICEEREWSVYEDEFGWELSRHTPAGEDFSFYVAKKDGIVEGVREYATYFDPDEHAEVLVRCRGMNGVPESIREIIDDAEEIQNMLEELSEALQEAEENG